MANPFTAVVISGYNANPPADDGSAVETNQLEWQKHLDKIGAPLKAAIESINTNALAGFGRRIGTTISEHATSYQIVPSDQGKFLIGTGTVTFTLPAVVDAGIGMPLLIINDGAGIVTVDGNASELISGDTTKTLYPGDALFITCDGSAWNGVLIPGVISGSFTGTFSETTEPGTITINYRRHGRRVHLWANSTAFGTSNSIAHTMTGLPAELQPTGTRRCPCSVYDNGTETMGQAILSNGSGTITFQVLRVSAAPGNAFPQASSFTGSGNKGLITGWAIDYVI